VVMARVGENEQRIPPKKSRQALTGWRPCRSFRPFYLLQSGQQQSLQQHGSFVQQQHTPGVGLGSWTLLGQAECPADGLAAAP
jgi:hypothetical protein